MRILFLAILLSACVAETPAAPTVYVHTAPGDTHGETYVDAVHSWLDLGFRGTLSDPGLTECPRLWYSEGLTECQISITIWPYPNLIRDHTAIGLSNRERRQIMYESTLTGYYEVLPVSAHEFGHILLDAGHHEGTGIMMAGGGTWSPSEDDLALACESIGVCL